MISLHIHIEIEVKHTFYPACGRTPRATSARVSHSSKPHAKDRDFHTKRRPLPNTVFPRAFLPCDFESPRSMTPVVKAESPSDLSPRNHPYGAIYREADN